ncbi:hypothetical protein DFQ28_010637 [Apophysomyces sp. BC1034]|nr:hypothetical protein DFQ30_010230 [Apophysomyces sp. BC1015]KAG0184745.1 hypothetical protein DFQ28_010637 [Apophysomyces sp. BC1034]
MANLTQFFRIATEGATTDGRTIERAQIEQMAAHYNPAMYGARVYLEHIRGILPDSPFRAYGDVLALKTREVENGKLALFAQIEPTQDLIALTRARQKVYTSIELDPSFADTKQAYLVGLAITDSPASLGTEILKFAAQHPDRSPLAHRKRSPGNVFSASIEAAIELERDTPTQATPSVFAKVAELLRLARKKTADDDTRFADTTRAIEALATHSAEQAQRLNAAQSTIEKLHKQCAELQTLHTQLSATDERAENRPIATGGHGTVMADY